MKFDEPRHIHLPAGVLGLALSADGEHLFASCMDGGIFAVPAAGGDPKPFTASHQSYASSCVLLPDEKTVISGGYDGYLLWHEVEKRRLFRCIKAHDFWSWKLALSPDGHQVASVTGQYLAGGEKYEPATDTAPTVKVFSTETGDVIHAFSHNPPVQSVAFSPNGVYLAAANMMGEIRVWNVSTGDEMATWKTPDFTCWGITKSPHYVGGIYDLAFAPDGQSLLGCGMGPMRDPMAGNGKMTWQRWAWVENPPKLLDQIHDGEHGTGLMEALAHTPDAGAFLMAGRQAQGTWNAAIFSASDGKLLASIDTKSRVTRGIFAPDGKTLFLGATNGQPARDKDGRWPDYGRIHVVPITG